MKPVARAQAGAGERTGTPRCESFVSLTKTLRVWCDDWRPCEMPLEAQRARCSSRQHQTMEELACQLGSQRGVPMTECVWET